MSEQKNVQGNSHDQVSSPSHYNQGSIECIEGIEAALSEEQFKGYLRGCAIKYLWRAPYKGSEIQDMKKGAWYIERYIERYCYIKTHHGY